MKNIVLIVGSLLVSVSAFSQTYVNGYVKKDGTYVAPHYRSAPNSTTNDNWSTKGNVNPYTGTPGTQTPSYGTGSSGSSYGTGSSYGSGSSGVGK